MKSLIFLSILSIQTHVTTSRESEESAGIETRIAVLKREILEEIQDQQHRAREEPFFDHYSDAYEYVDNSNKPITPIMENDKRKLKDRFKLPELRSTTTPKFVASDTSPEAGRSAHLRIKKHKTYKRVRPSKPREIFYRKMIFDDQEMNRPQKWTQCLDLITPFLSGYTENITRKYVTAKDRTVLRLAHLLSLNVTDHTKEDIRSILYQISNLQLRLFQWDVDAIRTIFNVIIKDGKHDFKSLKYGLKELFHSWKLDLSDMSSILHQARIFRPPCIQVSEFGGSTLTPKLVTYSKPTTKKCPDENASEC